MEIQTSSFGTQEINSDDIISFPIGMLDLEEHTKYKLFHQESDNPTVYFLQSITDPTIQMTIVSPETFGLEYEIELSDEEEVMLKIDNPEDVIVVLAVYKSFDIEKLNEEGVIKVLAKSPIIINTVAKVAIQKTLDKLRVKD